MTRDEKIKAIIEYLEENDDILTECAEQLDDYNGYLGDERFYDMESLNDIYHATDPTEILTRAFYGHDADTYHTNAHGERVYGAFNPNRDYFTFNGYGNLISCDWKDYSAHLDKWLVEELAENRVYIDAIEEDDDLAELFNALEEDDEDEESEG